MKTIEGPRGPLSILMISAFVFILKISYSSYSILWLTLNLLCFLRSQRSWLESLYYSINSYANSAPRFTTYWMKYFLPSPVGHSLLFQKMDFLVVDQGAMRRYVLCDGVVIL